MLEGVLSGQYAEPNMPHSDHMTLHLSILCQFFKFSSFPIAATLCSDSRAATVNHQGK
jgi:hypothetical protein